MNRSKKNIHVLITDGEIKFALPVIRCLSKHKFIKIHIVSKYKWIEAKFSRHIASFNYYQKKDIKSASDWIQIIKQEIVKHKIDILFPVNVTEIRLLSEFKDEFDSSTHLLLPTVKSFDIAHDKWRLFEFLERNNINRPATFNSKSIDPNHIPPMNFPVLSKPLSKSGGDGIEKISTEKSLKVALNKHPESIIQEYINGYDIDMSVLCRDGKILSHTIQKGYWKNIAPFSMPYGVEFINNDELFETIKTLMKKLNWSGLAHIDLRYDEIHKDFKVIEINPRIWGSINASNRVGVNFSYYYCLAALGIEFETPNYRLEKCLNTYGLFKIIKAKILMKEINQKIPKNITISDKLHDPMPSLYKYFVVKLKKNRLIKGKFLQKFKHDIYCNFDTILK